jgi:pimeloyl-ACP methyl ester carboxylesterase
MVHGTTPFLLIPGLLCTSELYTPQLPFLWRYGPVMVANHTQADSVQAIAKQILDAAPSKFVLMGLSMGGYLALEIMRQAPERVLRLALMDTSARPDTAEGKAGRQEKVKKARNGEFDKVVSDLLPAMLLPEHLKNEQLVQTNKRMAQVVGIEGFARQQQAIMDRPDSRSGLSRIQCPTLVLVGREDKLIPLEHSKEMADQIKGAQLVTIPECGHIATLEQPEKVNNALEQWLQQAF